MTSWREERIKDEYRKDIDRDEWRSVKRYDIMNSFRNIP